MGNHDRKNIRQGYMNRFEEVAVQMQIEIGKRSIYLNHYPFLCYGGAYRDVWQLFGHVHTCPDSKQVILYFLHISGQKAILIQIHPYPT